MKTFAIYSPDTFSSIIFAKLNILSKMVPAKANVDFFFSPMRMSKTSNTWARPTYFPFLAEQVSLQEENYCALWLGSHLSRHLPDKCSPRFFHVVVFLLFFRNFSYLFLFKKIREAV